MAPAEGCGDKHAADDGKIGLIQNQRRPRDEALQ